jgi:VanZ family protein
MTPVAYSRLFALAGAALVVAIAVDSLVPAGWQIRLGLHWLIEHFLAYFAVTFVLCLAWRRPLVVAGLLMMLAALLEASQGLTSDRVPDLATAFCGAAGVMVGALLADLVVRAQPLARAKQM